MHYSETRRILCHRRSPDSNLALSPVLSPMPALLALSPLPVFLPALLLALLPVLARFIPDNCLNLIPPITRHPTETNFQLLARIPPPITYRWAKPLNLRNPHQADPLDLRPPRLLFRICPRDPRRPRLRHSTVHSPRPIIHKAPPARRAKAAAFRWCWERLVVGASWPTRVRPSRLRDTIKLAATARARTAACCLSSVGRRAVIGAPSRKNRVFWARKVLDRLSVDNLIT